MKILLVAINAKYVHSNLAVASIYEYCGDYKKYMEVCEYTINQDTDSIIKDIYQKKPEVIGFSCYLWNITVVKEVIKELGKLLKGTDIWLGGPEVSFDSERLVEELDIKGIMCGEGEKIFRNLMTHYIDGGNLENIKGICYKNQEEIKHNPVEELLDMDELPFVYEKLEPYKNKIIYYESSRGCPYGCAYCMSSVDKSVRFRSLERVFLELKHFIDNKVPQVKFVDRTFNISHQRTEAILKFLLENDNGITNFHFEVSADILTQNELEIMKKMRPGLIQLEIGIQSTNSETLKAIHRTNDNQRIFENINKIQQFENIHCHVDLIAGLPYENLESFKKSFNQVYSLQCDQLQLGFLKVLKGAPLESRVAEYGIVYHDKAPYEVLYTNVLSYEDIIELKGVEEMLEVYYNSRLFDSVLKCILKYFESPYDLYKKLWDYYVEKGYDLVKQSRISRYEILREFYYVYLEESQAKKIDDVLIFNLYQRENLKTRPSFSMGYSEYREKTADIYKKILEEYRGREYHIEIFDVDVEKAQTGKIIDKKVTILFDYSAKKMYNGNVVAKIID